MLSNGLDVRYLIKQMIDRDASIKLSMKRGLLNIRALARYIKNELENQGYLEVTLDSIINVIRRCYGKNDALELKLSEIVRFYERRTMKNKIVDIKLVNDPEVRRSISTIASLIDYSKGETLRIIAGVEAITLIVDEKNVDTVRKYLPKEKIIRISKDLAEIIISLPPEAEKTPGVVSTLTTELALNGVNLIEIMSCVPEIIMVVEEKDALKVLLTPS